MTSGAAQEGARSAGGSPEPPLLIFRTCSMARRSDRLLFRIPPHRSPTPATRPAIVRSVNVRGPTSPRSTSSHVHGADTGAPGFARTA